MRRQRGSTVIYLKDVVAGRAMADALQKSVVSPQRLAALFPAHAAYIYAQNQVSVMAEMLTELEAMTPFADLIAEAQDVYLPGGPPMSPLTGSYFTCWAFFDACHGRAKETIGTIILEVGAELGVHTDLLHVIRLMQQSRMGIYLHEGIEGHLAVLRDLTTDAVCRCVVPAGYIGEKGQIWYVRVLPPPLPNSAEYVVFTTPYILLAPGLSEWMAYMQRVSPQTSQQARIEKCEQHMKYGPTRSYWNEFVFESYVNYRAEAVFLEGLPDVPASRPCSPLYKPRGR